MIRQFDERTLSAYLDGELDDATMQEVDEFLQKDAGARDYVLNAARTTAFLKAASNAILHEEVPEDLVADRGRLRQAHAAAIVPRDQVPILLE